MPSWVVRFRVRQYLKGSVWVIPLLGALAGAALGPLSATINENLGIPSHWEYSPSTATAILAAVVGAAAALSGFVVTVSVLVVQIAEGSLSSRYMRIWFRDRMLKIVLAVLLGTLTFAMQELRRVGTTTVPNTGVTLAESLLVVGLVVFLLFLDRALHRVRPVAVAALVGKNAREAWEEGLQMSAASDSPNLVVGLYESDETPTHVVTSARAGALQAVAGHHLVRFARRHDCQIVLLHTVGDFISHGAPLLAVYDFDGELAELEGPLRGMVALGNERTIDQDPAFGIRILVDIANMALSPAVNDPTTAVQIIDHLGDTLHMLGMLDESTVRGPRGERPFVIVPTRSWEEIVTLAVTEIREYGAASIQVNRRLRSMLESLLQALPAERRGAVVEELTRLDAGVARAFADSVDLDRAGEADPQGIGGTAQHQFDRGAARASKLTAT